MQYPIHRRKLRQLDARNAVWRDPFARLSAAPTWNGNGWSVSLTGGWSSTDPFDGAYVIYPAIPMRNVANWFILAGELIERTAPNLSSDIEVRLGVCNEDVDSATIDAVFWGIEYTTASRQGRRGQVVNGVASSGGAGLDATARIAQGLAYKLGTGAAARFQGVQGRLLDGSAAVTTALMNNSDFSAPMDNIAPRPFISFGRLTATDVVTRTLVMDFQISELFELEFVL